jgi:hypothetical protein
MVAIPLGFNDIIMQQKRLLFISVVLFISANTFAQSIVSPNRLPSSLPLTDFKIYVDPNDFELVRTAAGFLQSDIEMVTGKKLPFTHEISANEKNIIVAGTLGQSAFIKTLVTEKKIDTQNFSGKWEAYKIQSLKNSKGQNLLVIAGSDRRGTAFGIFELSKQLGVSPWYWWADVPVKKQAGMFVRANILITDAPRVKYRGIFINDEAPALSNWSKVTFGGFNHTFYEKVFELMLRLKANYLWPAMWGNAFYYDDSLNIRSADKFGIVIGTSHHEPLMRAHEEWKYSGAGKWNYDSNEVKLKEFWRTGMQRATNEKIVTIGMRGDGDEPMSRETATSLLERIVKDQRNIIAQTTGKPAAETPQLWALYKEVQDYYDKGMRVPDDVTLLLCDDNWGNIRKLPKLNEQPRKGGYGIYYHFDYVGGPRNYKWVNTNPVPRVWEQMHLAWEYNVRDIWIVNVGDIKPMEFPISFFLDYAWNPEKITEKDLQGYTTQWAAAQFGSENAAAIAAIISTYSKYNGRRKPELLDANTYSPDNYNEAQRVTADYNRLLAKAEKINNLLPAAYRDAYFQLVLHPVKACANLQELYTAVAKNKKAYEKNDAVIANDFAKKAQQLYGNDSLITLQYHRLKNGKWNHMMSQTHIGYTYWQQPLVQKMPEVKFLTTDVVKPPAMVLEDERNAIGQRLHGENAFFENEYSGVSMEAAHYSRAINTNGMTWTILPDHGKTGDAVTTFPVTAPVQQPKAGSARLEYDFYTFSEGNFSVYAYFSPTLNFHNSETGLQYAVSVDDEAPQIISINKDDKNGQTWNGWVANNIIIKRSTHTIAQKGKHIIKYWMVDPAVVLQKLVLDFGTVIPSYLGPPETQVK